MKAKYWVILSCANLWGWGLTFKWKLLSSTFLWYFFNMLYKVFLTFESVNEILTCDHFFKNESLLLTEQYFHAVVFTNKILRTLASQDGFEQSGWVTGTLDNLTNHMQLPRPPMWWWSVNTTAKALLGSSFGKWRPHFWSALSLSKPPIITLSELEPRVLTFIFIRPHFC